MGKIDNIKIIEIPKIEDRRGNLAVIEKDLLPYEVKRVYYLYDVPSDAYRGGSLKSQQKCVAQEHLLRMVNLVIRVSFL